MKSKHVSQIIFCGVTALLLASPAFATPPSSAAAGTKSVYHSYTPTQYNRYCSPDAFSQKAVTLSAEQLAKCYASNQDFNFQKYGLSRSAMMTKLSQLILTTAE